MRKILKTSKILLSHFGRVKTPAFQAAASQHFFFFTFGSYDAYGNTWSERPS
jgi:hypothetical protein